MQTIPDSPLLLNLNQSSVGSQLSKKQFNKKKEPLKQLFEQVNKILEPLTTLKVNQSNKDQQIIDFSLGYNIQLHNLNQIIVESFGLEKIFVIPKSEQKGPKQFGSFKIFYFMMSLFTKNYQFEDEELKQIIQSNQDILKYWNIQGYVFLGQKNDLVKMEEFISALKYIFQEEYIQKLKEILKILCAILKLNYINDLKENNCEREIQQTVQCKQEKYISISQALEISTNTTNEQDENDNCEIDQNLVQDTNTVNGEQNLLSDLILNTFKDLLGVELNNENTPKIKQLHKNYSGNTIVFLLNPNRLIGQAQFLYSKLIQSFFIKVGLASSQKLQQLEQLYKEGQATFLRFPDYIFGGNQVNPFSSNCYIINCQRNMMDYWFEIQKNQNENEKIYLANLQQESEKLKKKNDYQSIRQFFQPFSIQKQYSNNILAQINHKCVDDNSNCTTFYELGDFCKVNKFEIDDIDKQISMTSNLQLLQNQQYDQNQKQSKQGVPSMISELLINFKKVQNTQNKINIYKIDKDNQSDVIVAYINNIKEQVVLDRRTMKEIEALYSDQQNEGSSSDGVSSCDRKSLNQFD